MTEWLKMVIEAEGYEVRTALIGTRGEEIFKQWRPDVVVTDLMLPDLDGIALLRRLKEIDPWPEIIVISGQGTMARAVEAGQAGAFYFLEKPVSQDGLIDMIRKAIDRTQERAEHQQLKEQIRGQYSFANIVGQSKKMKDLFELIESVAASDANILIQGENGTGKELIANAIHYNSNRVKGPFIKINCAAIPKDLIESELFGYKKGAFTGAKTDKIGLFEMAEGGSLLLDEIGEMPPYLQTKLLRVLQEREYRPIGSDRLVHVDFRLICATNIDLDVALREGKLREDLYFRINTITLRVPPLRERSEDIPLLCNHFLVEVQPAVPEERAVDLAGGVSPADPQPLGRQRARAGERHRARRARVQDRRDHAATICPSRSAKRGVRRRSSPSRRTGRWPRSRRWPSCRRCSGPTGTSRKRRRSSACIARRSTAR